MKLFNRTLRPVHLVLIACAIVFAWNSNELASVEREIAPALTELTAATPGAVHGSGMRYFIREYQADPFRVAVGLSSRQLQLCRQISASIPAYESARSWRNKAVGIGVLALLFLGLGRYLPAMKRGASSAEYQQAAWLLSQRLAMLKSRVLAKLPPWLLRKRGTPHAVHSIVTCPSCSRKLRLPAGKGRLRATCPGCGTQFECVT